MGERDFLKNLLAACIISFAIFIAFPEIDLIVTGWFFDPVTRTFPAKTFADIRSIYIILARSIALICFILWIKGVFFQRQACHCLYGFTTFMTIIVNGGIVDRVFKTYWGRARPDDVTQFGGEALFTPPLPWPVDQCASNCSFVSGEAAAAFTIIIACYYALCRKKTGELCMFRLGCIIAFWSPMALLRIVVGKHFLSDIIFSFLIVAIAATIYKLSMRFQAPDLQLRFVTFHQNLIRGFYTPVKKNNSHSENSK